MYLGPYQLGYNDDPECGIYTGDARELARAIPDESVDLVITDPPFGIGFQYANGYDDNPAHYLDLVRWIVAESNRIIKPGCLCFVFQAGLRLEETWPLFPTGKRIFAACKNFVQMLPTPVQFSFDPVIFWQKPGEYPREAHGRDWHIGNTAPTSHRGMNEAGWHSCPRPLDTITYMVDNFCPLGGTVLDFFMGSGTAAVAAKITGRRYLGFEIVSSDAEQARARVRNAPPPLSNDTAIPEQAAMELP